MGHNVSSAKRKTHSVECPQKEIREAYTRRLMEQLKVLEEKETNSPRRRRRQEIIKRRAEINQVKTGRTIQESTKPKAGSLKKSTT